MVWISKRRLLFRKATYEYWQSLVLFLVLFSFDSANKFKSNINYFCYKSLFISSWHSGNWAKSHSLSKLILFLMEYSCFSLSGLQWNLIWKSMMASRSAFYFPISNPVLKWSQYTWSSKIPCWCLSLWSSSLK